MNQPESDCRYRWLSETISNLLGISERKFADALLIEHNDQINGFFNDDIDEFSESNNRLLFVWRTFYDKLVEEAITVLEEGELMAFESFSATVMNSNYVEFCSLSLSVSCGRFSFGDLQSDRRRRRPSRRGRGARGKVSASE